MQNQRQRNNSIEPDTETFHDYLLFFGGQMVSLLGSSIVQFVIIWWITIETKSAFYLAMASFLGFGSTIAVSLFAGVFVDRWNRKLLLGIVDFLQALATMILLILFWLQIATIFHILSLLTLRGVFQGFHEPAMNAIMPIMIPEEKLSRVNGINYLLNGVIYLIGPVVAAILLGIFGMENIHYILFIDAITFLIAVIPLIIITIPEVKTTAQVEGKSVTFKDEFIEGVSFITQKKGLLSLLAVFTGANLFFTPLMVLLPLIIIDPTLIGGTATTLAIALAINQVGTILGSLLMSSKNIFKNNTTGVAIGIFLGTMGLLVSGIGAITSQLIFLYIGLGLIGLTLPIANVSSQTIWQTAVPADLQGRVFSVRRTIAQISSPVAMALAGVVAEVIGIVTVIIGSAILEFILLSYSWFFTGFPEVEASLKQSEQEIDMIIA